MKKIIKNQPFIRILLNLVCIDYSKIAIKKFIIGIFRTAGSCTSHTMVFIVYHFTPTITSQLNNYFSYTINAVTLNYGLLERKNSKNYEIIFFLIMFYQKKIRNRDFTFDENRKKNFFVRSKTHLLRKKFYIQTNNLFSNIFFSKLTTNVVAMLSFRFFIEF